MRQSLLCVSVVFLAGALVASAAPTSKPSTRPASRPTSQPTSRPARAAESPAKAKGDEAFSKLKKGMTIDQVHQIIGEKPDRTMGGGEGKKLIEAWDTLNISVSFVGGVATQVIRLHP